MSEEIKIIIGKDGSVHVSVNGVKGAGCKDLTKSLQAAIGDTFKETNTTEFYQSKIGIGQKQYGG